MGLLNAGEAPKHIEFVRVPRPDNFPDFQEQLTAIGGVIPDGRPRFKLEWGGEETARFGKFQVAKYRYGMKDQQIGWLVLANPLGKTKRDRQPLHIKETDLDKWPREYEKYKKRVMIPFWVRFDIPICNWYISEWLSPKKCAVGWEDARYVHEGGHTWDALGPPPAHGTYWPLLRINDPENPGLYMEPADEHLGIIRQFVKIKSEDPILNRFGIDEPGDDFTLQAELDVLDRAMYLEAEAQAHDEKEFIFRTFEKGLENKKRIISI